MPVEELGRKKAREFLDWVYERAVSEDGGNPGRTSNKARDHRAPLAFRAITTLPQPSVYSALINGYDGESPCCRRKFDDA